MGTLYRPRYRDRHGVVQESAVWWIRYRQHGQTVRESTETTSEKQAKQRLREREGRVALNIPVVPRADRLTLAEAAELIRQDYATNGRKSADSLEHRLAHLLAHFGEAMRLARLTTGHVEAYKTARLAAKAAPGTINRELAALGRMAALARHQHGLVVPFVVTLLEERNVRTGFFDDDAVEAVCRALRPELAALATVARLTGWRKSELRSRQWRHVDFAAGWLRLEPEETKNREGRMFPLIPELRAVLEAQRARVDAIQRETGRVIPWLFCRDDGEPVGDFKKAWRTACVAAGFFRVLPVLDAEGRPTRRKDGSPLVRRQPTKLVHDFRRTAVRNLIRAGIPETVAMKLTGHRTRSVFQRYAIVEEGMLREAGERLAAGCLARESGKDRPGSGKVVAISRQ
jgi:integrase